MAPPTPPEDPSRQHRPATADTADDTADAPPFDHRGQRSVCFLLERFERTAGELQDRDRDRQRQAGENDDSPPRTRVRTAYCFRRDPAHARAQWWNPGAGVYLTRFAQPHPRAPWERDRRGEVHVGDELAGVPSHVAAVAQRTFAPPIELTARYVAGFADGTHAGLLSRVAANVASGAPVRAAERIADLWAAALARTAGSVDGGGGDPPRASSQPGARDDDDGNDKSRKR
ncbi:hypothetical protein H9P43_008024 [Blastocladiella emersonii ATCC 22665]|nr:hypothetical protein H9P43_008008 [Blastocladiella emersonii ATCC 22665]KAI9168651.1 hypothetical protein H9P43_008024 [Blastocladiella emersonii ATCC 22665]